MNTKSLNTLSKNSKSFRFAGRFLSKDQLQEAATLYQFCRSVDDIADENSNADLADKELTYIINELSDKSMSIRYDLIPLTDLLNKYSISIQLPITLIKGVKSDLQQVRISDQDDLISYAYQVAGVVGLMMCPILKANSKGNNFAIDLGIAMQLTNIARDVYEDAQMDRRYLPYSWCPYEPSQILSEDPTIRKCTSKAIKKILNLADVYYASALNGLKYLPPRSRRAIAVALHVYKYIGALIEQSGFQYWKKRCVVPTYKKITIAINTLISTGNIKELNQNAHNDELHQALMKFKINLIEH